MSVAPTFVNGTAGDDIIDESGVGTTPVVVTAGDGNDDITLNGVNSTAYGGEGNDTVAANHGKDSVFGGEGDDSLMGQGSADTVDGGNGMDELYGGAGNDRLYGGEGDDYIVGGNGDDVMYGDKTHGQKDGTLGNDVFVFDSDDGNDKVWDFASGYDEVLLTDAVDAYVDVRAGNTYVTYGSTTMVFFGAELDAGDFDGLANLIFV